MSKNKFTKGPWQTINISWEYSVIINEDAARIAQVFIRDEVDEETQDKFEEIKDANANLIAAAPDMYEALEEVETFINNSAGIIGYHLNGSIAEWDDLDATRVINKALRKARGEEE